MSEVLTAQRIQELMAQSRNRGGHERMIRKFVAGGEMYATVSDMVEYKGKDITVVRNTLAQVAKKHDLSNVRLLKVDDETLIIVNTDLVETEEG